MYNYNEEKKNLFTEDGQVMFIAIRDRVKKLLSESGAFMMQNVLSAATGSAWTMLACVDRMVELGEIRELPQGNVAGQYRVFVKHGQL